MCKQNRSLAKPRSEREGTAAISSNVLVDYVMTLNPPRDIADKDTMFGGNRQHYFGVGRSAIMSILSAMTLRTAYLGGEQLPQTILDFGAGYGRVARYLREIGRAHV